MRTVKKTGKSPCHLGADILVAEEMANKTAVSQTPYLPDGGDDYGENQTTERDREWWKVTGLTQKVTF